MAAAIHHPYLLPVPDLYAPLQALATQASRSIPGADGVSVVVLQDGATVFAASNAFASSVDAVQYRLNQGPCLDAVAQRTTITSGSLALDENRWPEFRAEIEPFGVRSVLSLVLEADDHVIGSVNVYGRTDDGFDDEARRLGEVFAGPAASSLSVIPVLTGTNDVAAVIGWELEDRAVIDRAVGVLMAGAPRLTPTQAHAALDARAAETGSSTVSTAHRIVADREDNSET